MEDLGHQIKRIDRLFKLRMDRNLEKSGLTNSQMHVLNVFITSSRPESNTEMFVSGI